MSMDKNVTSKRCLVATLTVINELTQCAKLTKNRLYAIKQHELDLGKKLFARAYVRNNNAVLKPLSLFVDSGADISILNENYLNRLVDKKYIEKNAKPPDVNKIASYTKNGKLDYTNPPNLIFQSPVPMKVKTYYIHEHLLSSASSNIRLLPRESKPIRLYLHPACNYVGGEKILLKGGIQNNIELIPSQSTILKDRHGLYGIIMSTNLTNSKVNCLIKTNFEPTSDCEAIKITPMTISNLCQIPLWQPCYLYEIDDLRKTRVNIENLPIQSDITTQTIYQINVAQSPNNENDVKQLFENKHNYIDRGPTEPIIDDEFCLPQGYSVENKKYDLSPNEIVQLDKFPETHKQYIEDIFIKSYPKVLAQSSLSVGNLSATLGYYTVRLKPGVELPSHTKMYYLNESDKKTFV